MKLFLLMAFLSGANAHATIAKFENVAPGIYRGGNPILGSAAADGMSTLAGLHMKTDIDLQGGDIDGSLSGIFDKWSEQGEKPENIAAEKQKAESLGMTFWNFPLDSHEPVTTDEDQQIQKAVAILADPSQQPVFIHCEHGVDRTGLVVALYRVKVQKWEPDKAYAEWLKLGHGAWLDQQFTYDLDVYFMKATGWQKP